MMVGEDNVRTLLAVFAHPDDEAFGTGGTLARYAALGHNVYLVTATRGEAGEINQNLAGDSGGSVAATIANLPLVRERELQCACDAYGINPPIFLDYIDGQLPIVHQGQAVGKVVRIIREVRPDVLITFGPDGIYGHYDHIAAHRWATIAADLAASEDCFPDHLTHACRPHQASKVYYRVLPQARVDRMADEGRPAVNMFGVPFYFVGYPEHEITTIIDVGEWAKKKLAGIQCHMTQVSPESDYFQAPEEVLADPGFLAEHYILAQSTVGQPDATETDLLERLS